MRKVYTDHETLVREFGEPVIGVVKRTKKIMRMIIRRRKKIAKYEKLKEKSIL